MKCDICAESNIGPEHEITEKHIKNRVLYNYAVNRKQYAGNRKGVMVSCNVSSSFSNIVDFVDAKIKISAKPDEEIKFYFTIKNDTKKEEISVVFIQPAHDKLNFVMNNHGLEFGCNPVTIRPKSTLQREVSITFKNADVGQYEMPIIFSFRKPAVNDGILIIRDVVVFVEEQQRIHQKIYSPYAQKEVKAQKLFKTTLADRSDDMFRIPKNCKPIYASGLTVKEDASKEELELAKDIREIFTAGVTEQNYVRFFHNLLWYEETIVRINLKNYNMSCVPLLRRGDTYALVVPGLAEKRPSLMLGDLLFVKPCDNDEVMFEAIINDMSDNVVNLKGLHPEFEKYYSVGNEQSMFDVRFFMSRMPLERMHRAVQAAVQGSPDQRRVFPAPSENTPVPYKVQSFYNQLVEHNPEQRSAVEHIVGGTAGTAPYLLHGPPGTGKTITIVEAILQLVTKNPSYRILVCTDSNMAADHVATMLIKYADKFDQQKFLLRANSKYRVWETLPECLKKFSNGSCKNEFEYVTIEEFMTYNIVVTTLSHAAKYAKEARKTCKERPITHLFIDEAAQASEPACLIPICGLLSSRGSLTLAGDPLQLGPVVISHHARRLGLGLSLMERLMTKWELYSSNDANYTLMLRNNFRSDPAVLRIPNDLFYHGQLRALAAEDPLSSVDILGDNKHSRAIVFHGVLSKEQRMGKSPSFFNNTELDIVQKYIKALITRHKVLPEDIGVVTPYIRQVYKIKNWLQTTMWSGRVEVGTVEAFQGKEKRVILVSTVRANCSLLAHDAKYQLGFLVDDQRFNVALTRAKAKAVVIGNPLCLQRDVKWRTYMQHCREYGTYFGYDAPLPEQTKKDIVDRITPIIQDLKVKDSKGNRKR